MGNLTIFQKLNKVLGQEASSPTYVIDPKSFENLSDKERDLKKLEAQQTLYLQNQWKKIDNELYQKAVYYEPTRIAAYYDYEAMEYTPEIAVSLDIFSDEATTANESGKILTIFSESDRIKEELTDLFENVLDINTNLNSWARNLCKYGDNFVYCKIVPKQGVVGCTQLPNVEVTRSDPGFNFVTTHDNYQKERGTKFFWKDKNIEFNSFEVAHFRLMGDDRKLPYGTSLLEKVRRIWKQLLLSEDAMLVYRVTRAPERRVYKIFVGNMDDKDVDAYVDKIANNFKRVNMVDSNNGQQDTRYNSLAVDQDYFIPVRDPGLAMPIETLPGAQNLAEIADIEYIQKKMLAALRVPKAFIGFDEATGEGKNLAILDIRFARAVHRVQKALIQELNKIAIIHLYTKGYEEDLNNFTLQLTSPSTQADMLKVENWKEKFQLFRDAVEDLGQGFGAVSMTWAKKEILGMSDDDIRVDIQRQAVERAAGEELKMIGETIKQTGMFREIYKAYKINPDNMAAGNNAPNNEPPGGGGGGGGSFGGGSDVGADFTTPLDGSGGQPGMEGGDAGNPNGMPGEPGAEGGADQGDEPMGSPDEKENVSESIKRNNEKRHKSLNESIRKSIDEIDRILEE